MPSPTKVQIYKWRKVMEDYNSCCAGCGSILDLCYDHIIPKSQGGTDDPTNMQILCHHCNNRKNKTNGLPRLDPRMPIDSCTIIKANREVFVMWLEEMRKNYN